jgi:hypothetical protein
MVLPTQEDCESIERVLGRRPSVPFLVVVRGRGGRPVVILNRPLTPAGAPMPTILWLVGKEEIRAVSRLEASGGVKLAASEVPQAAVEAAHSQYRQLRESLFLGPALGSGGVGGTARGVKCLHAHLAAYLAGLDDAVGRWTAERVGLHGEDYDRLPWLDELAAVRHRLWHELDPGPRQH